MAHEANFLCHDDSFLTTRAAENRGSKRKANQVGILHPRVRWTDFRLLFGKNKNLKIGSNLVLMATKIVCVDPLGPSLVTIRSGFCKFLATNES
jgi:hypothetical protein